LIGLDPTLPFPARSTPSFDLKRARLPEPKFKEICDLMEGVMKEYGPPKDEEVHSRYMYITGKSSLTDVLDRNHPHV
jgi:hypothetical protein